MADRFEQAKWLQLQNPFMKVTDTSEVITGHVSGRKSDIIDIITGQQSAIILASAPLMGKTTLIRYLQRSPHPGWSWRNELGDVRSQFDLDDVHFVQIDLTKFEEIGNPIKTQNAFIKACIQELAKVYSSEEEMIPFSRFDLKELYALLEMLTEKIPQGRYFVMLDSISRLGWQSTRDSHMQNRLQTPQESGLAVLDTCNIIGTIVDLLDDFNNFGVILSIESLPRPGIDHQFSHVSPHLSAELSRFQTTVLKACTWDDATAFLAQEPESFGETWAKNFRASGGKTVFSAEEQIWLHEQAGSHPYLLQQLCLLAFRQKALSSAEEWTELQESDKTALIETIDVSLSSFLGHTWTRVKEALEHSSSETRSTFEEFINFLLQRSPTSIIDVDTWRQLGKEVHYILYNEGIVRYEPKGTRFPGAILRNYLIRKAQEEYEWFTSSPLIPVINTRGIQITRPGYAVDFLSLTEIEFRLVGKLLQQPYRITEEGLKKAAWDEPITSRAFSQRMHHLRTKLKKRCEMEIIENRYGGVYTFVHPEWFELTQ